MAMLETDPDDLFERLSDYDYQRAYRWRTNRKLENTTGWILKQSDVLAWLRGEGPQCLWLSGIGELSYISLFPIRSNTDILHGQLAVARALQCTKYGLNSLSILIANVR
jgi:hypothetical protein